MPDGPFATDRTRRWRQTSLRDFSWGEIETVEKFGFQVLGVAGASSSPSFAYTFALFDTSGLPEMIAVGLSYETAFALLNEAADRLRNGVNLSQGRHTGLLAGVECEFRPVDTNWVKCLMLGATWFYQGTEFPVLQAVYPDLENRFPEEANFDLSFAQPLLQPGASFGRIEEEFWKAHEKDIVNSGAILNVEPDERSYPRRRLGPSGPRRGSIVRVREVISITGTSD
jgi:hypothetical protein